MTDEFAGKQIIITGASSGIGAHMALFFASHGMDVALLARREDRLSSLATQIEKLGVKAIPLAVDISSAKAVKQAIDYIWEKFSGFDYLLNNAGIVGKGESHRLPSEEWDQVIATNLSGVFYMAQSFASKLIDHQKNGVIVNVSSILGKKSLPGLAGYCASKAAVIQLSEVLALEWAKHNIRVNTIAPGYIITDLNREFLTSPRGQAMKENIPQKRLGELSDLEGGLRYLFSNQSKYMTGQLLTIDGGHSLHF